jgi:hypothetical protein
MLIDINRDDIEFSDVKLIETKTAYPAVYYQQGNYEDPQETE